MSVTRSHYDAMRPGPGVDGKMLSGQCSKSLPVSRSSMTALEALLLPTGRLFYWQAVLPTRLPLLLAIAVMLFAVSSGQAEAGPAIIPDQLSALHDLDPVIALHSNPCNPVNGVGVVCTVAGNVLSVSFASKGLRGIIPESVSALTALTSLDLSFNSFTGALPNGLSNLVKLQHLNLVNNHFGPSLPPILTVLTSITYLFLSSNSFTGSLPDGLSNLSNLQYLSLSNNNFKGALPDGLSNLANLHHLSLSSNAFTGALPDGLANLANLPHLSTNKDFHPLFPSILTRLSNLTYLDLSTNYFTGSLPDSLSNLANLQYLFFSFNMFTGALPGGLSNLVNLQYLSLSYNAFNGGLPDGMSNLANLHYLSLQSNVFGPSSPSILTILSSLTYLDISRNNFASTFPDGLSNNALLQHLDMSFNYFNGTLPDGLSHLANLNFLDLSLNSFKGALPDGLSNLANLQLLDLSHNSFVGGLPPGLSYLVKLTSFHIGDNKLKGTIPATFGNLQDLTALDIHNSGLSCPKLQSACVDQQSTSSPFCTICSDFCSTCSSSITVSSSPPSHPPAPPPFIPPPLSPPPPPSPTNLPIGLIVGIGVGALVVLLITIGAALIIVQRRTVKRKGPTSKEASLIPSTCKAYSLSQLQQATDGWSDANILGTGGFGVVYKGRDPNNPDTLVAVKRATVQTAKFREEVRVVAGLHHPHIVHLLGYCDEYNAERNLVEQVLVYEFVPNGDLEGFLKNRDDIGLEGRVNILIDVALGIQYLHSFNIIHRDIKPQNVLLGRDLEAKLADFGSVREMKDTMGITTRLIGTPGYMDPAYLQSKRPTPALDVYSFGILMVELLTCARTREAKNDGITYWFRPLLSKANSSRDTSALLHPAISVSHDVILDLLHLADKCIDMSPASRPTILEVFTGLNSMKAKLYGHDVPKYAKKLEEDVSRGEQEVSISLDEEMRLCMSGSDTNSKPSTSSVAHDSVDSYGHTTVCVER